MNACRDNSVPNQSNDFLASHVIVSQCRKSYYNTSLCTGRLHVKYGKKIRKKLKQKENCHYIRPYMCMCTSCVLAELQRLGGETLRERKRVFHSVKQSIEQIHTSNCSDVDRGGLDLPPHRPSGGGPLAQPCIFL